MNIGLVASSAEKRTCVFTVGTSGVLAVNRGLRDFFSVSYRKASSRISQVGEIASEVVEMDPKVVETDLKVVEIKLKVVEFTRKVVERISISSMFATRGHK